MISNQEVILRILTAALLGAVIGVNRGRLEWAAGLRTHMLVSVGAALAVIVSAYGFNHALLQEHVVLDPSRIAAQVVSGIGFLGAGTIMFMAKEQVVKGLTTAAGLWAVAAVGLASGAGLYVPAVVATLVLWIILALLKPIERRFVRRRRRYALLVVSISHGSALAAVERVLSEYRAPVDRLQLKRDAEGSDVVTARFPASFASEKLGEIADACRSIEGSGEVTIALPG